MRRATKSNRPFKSYHNVHSRARSFHLIDDLFNIVIQFTSPAGSLSSHKRMVFKNTPNNKIVQENARERKLK